MRARRVDPKLLLASFVIAAGVVLVGYGVMKAQTGKDEQGYPEAVESVSPARGAIQVVQQDQLVVDLKPGYEAVIVLDGVELPQVELDTLNSGVLPKPGQQIDIPPAVIHEPGNNTFTYTPVAGGPVEKYRTGLNEAQVIFWKATEGRTRALVYDWTFTVE